MATLKKDQAEAIRKSAEEKFSDTAVDDQTKVDPVPELQQKIVELQTATLKKDEELQKLKIENEAAIENARQLERLAVNATRLEEDKNKLEQETAKLKATMAALQNEKPDDSIAKLAELEGQKIQLEEKIKALDRENQALKSEVKREVASTNKMDDLQKQLSTSEQARQELEDQKRNLEKEIAKSNTAGSMQQQSFIAFFINWSSKDHDIDMTIQDPNGKAFDFKKRKYPGQPGLFALDTRRGPGAELWQSDRLIPGVYTASYLFYNQYGNSQPATVSGTIFTPKGSTEVPAIEMTIDKRRKYQVRFEVDKDGNVKMLDSK